MPYDHDIREFARSFWPAVSRDAEVACFRADFGIINRKSMNYATALFLCNEEIYSPHAWRARRPSWGEISGVRPLRCVLSPETPEDYPEIVRCVRLLERQFALRKRETIVVDQRNARYRKRERVVVYEFVPRESARPPTIAIKIND
jgi:hypothetical protein